jgi:hypothetical protein
MKGTMNKVTLVALGGLLGASLAACSSSGSDVAGADAAPPQSQESGDGSGTTPASAGSALLTQFSDTFEDDRNGWALPATENASSEVVDGDFVLETKIPLSPHLIAKTLVDAYDQGRLSMTDVVVRSSFTNKRGAPALGVFCREVPDPDGDFQWYEFVVRDGYAAIRLADLAGHLDVLAETEDVSLRPGAAAEISGTCVDTSSGKASLGLQLDGREVLSTEVGDPLGNGAAGVQSYDARQGAANGSTILWHDFSVEPA